MGGEIGAAKKRGWVEVGDAWRWVMRGGGLWVLRKNVDIKVMTAINQTMSSF